MKFAPLIILAVLLLASCNSEPEKDPILNKLNEIPHFNADEVLKEILADPNFEKEYVGKQMVIKGKISDISLKRHGKFALKLHPSITPIYCEMKPEQEYYKRDLKINQTVSIVGKVEVFRYTTERGEKQAYLTLRNGVFVW